MLIAQSVGRSNDWIVEKTYLTLTIAKVECVSQAFHLIEKPLFLKSASSDDDLWYRRRYQQYLNSLARFLVIMCPSVLKLSSSCLIRHRPCPRPSLLRRMRLSSHFPV